MSWGEETGTMQTRYGCGGLRGAARTLALTPGRAMDLDSHFFFDDGSFLLEGKQWRGCDWFGIEGEGCLAVQVATGA